MADQTPPNDPMGNRLRATFTAERDDIERRHLAEGQATAPGRSRSLKWIPFAVAAALIAIAGFAFIASRDTDRAVDLDTATQPADEEVPDNQPSEVAGPVDAEGNPLPTPNTIPIGTEPIPYLTGENMCGDLFEPELAIVAGRDGADAPAIAEPDASETVAPLRMLAPGSTIELVGGCTRGLTSLGTLQWYELKGEPGEPNDWILSTDLQPTPRTGPTPAENTCGTNVPLGPHFVWDIAVDDPDGGLVAHAAPGVDETITRMLPANEVVMPTRGCVVGDAGSTWYELFGPLGLDWVNARFLRATEPACVFGDRPGAFNRDGSPPDVEFYLHTVVIGETLNEISLQYGVFVDDLIRVNLALDPDALLAGTKIVVPAEGSLITLRGPIDGSAVADGDVIAFSPSLDPATPATFAPIESSRYRWYTADGVSLGASCSDGVSPASDGPMDKDSLDVRPCTQGGAPQVNPENDQLYLSTSAGDQNSPADHVHDIRTESNDTCTRIVVTFGENANEDADGPAAALPPIIVYKGSEFVRISPSGWAMESAFMDPDRIDYPGGIGLLAINPGFNFSVELMHREMEPHVRFFDNPARVVVDLYPVDSPDPTVTGPFGERFVLRAPIQSNLTGSEVFGFGRPYEAAGLYRIWSVPDDVDADEFLAEPPAPQLEAFFPTSGWAEGWGSFNVDLPELAPGTYIAVFGELPPTDEIGFYGTGQLFRVTEAGTVAPDAVLLPDVQLPPE